jgi:hypothetical protein
VLVVHVVEVQVLVVQVVEVQVLVVQVVEEQVLVVQVVEVQVLVVQIVEVQVRDVQLMKVGVFIDVQLIATLAEKKLNHKHKKRKSHRKFQRNKISRRRIDFVTKSAGLKNSVGGM